MINKVGGARKKKKLYENKIRDWSIFSREFTVERFVSLNHEQQWKQKQKVEWGFDTRGRVGKLETQERSKERERGSEFTCPHTRRLHSDAARDFSRTNQPLSRSIYKWDDLCCWWKRRRKFTKLVYAISRGEYCFYPPRFSGHVRVYSGVSPPPPPPRHSSRRLRCEQWDYSNYATSIPKKKSQKQERERETERNSLISYFD